MKFRILLFAVSIMTMFVGCQKEFSVENGSPATGTLKSGVSGDCLPSSISGVFIVDTALTVANFINVEVDVTSTGAYSIKSDTLNGYYFTDAGTFGSTGLQTIKLKGTGKPLLAGTNSFTITFGTSSCTIDITVLPSGTSAAVFTLGGTPGSCSGATVNGTYNAGSLLTISNSIVFDVLVTSVGTYTITSNAVNGISFSQSGFFSTTGPQSVTLAGSGTPLAAGTNNYTVTAGTSSCTFSIAVLAAAGPAVFTLGGAPNGCTGFVLAGTYATGTALTAGNTVSLQVNVTTAGTYTISTNTVNGISFSASGTFATTGSPQTVILTGTGTPSIGGAFNYTVTAGTSTCTFSITFTGAAVNNDYFPLTANSFWTYDSDLTVPDTLYYLSSTNTTIGGNVYRYLSYGAGPVGIAPADSIAYRKAGNDYFENNLTDFYSSFSFDNPVNADINFLKENAATGTTWTTPVFSGTVTPQGGPSIPVQVKYSFTITNASTSFVVNGVTYNNVIHVSWKSQENISNTGFNDALFYESYYAKGIGLIEFTLDVPFLPGIEVTNLIRHYQVF